MRDGCTKKMTAVNTVAAFEELRTRFRVRLVALNGRQAGTEYEVNRERVTLGRGPGVDIAFDEQTMSRQHAALEFAGGGFRVQDLGSTNGIVVNGQPVQVAELEHGDRFEIGSQEIQFVVEQREEEPETYELSADV